MIHPRQYNIEHRFASLNINYLGRMIFDIEQKDMEYLLIIWGDYSEDFLLLQCLYRFWIFSL